MRARRYALFAALVAACSRDTVTLKLPAIPQGMRAAIVAFVHDDQVLASALDLASPVAGRALPVVLGGERPIDVFVLFYARTLEDLRVPPGVLLRASGGSGRRLPAFDRAYVAMVRERSATAFMPAEVIAPELAAFELEVTDVNRCARFSERVFDLSTRARAHAVVAIDEGGVLLALTDGRFVVVSADAAVELEVRTDIEPESAVRAANGDIWLGGQRGRIAILDRTLTSTRAFGRRPHGQQITFLAGAPPEELFVVTRQGLFERLEGSEWTELSGVRSLGSQNFGGVLWLGPGKALANPPLTQELLRYDRGRLLESESLPVASGEVSDLTMLEDGAVVAKVNPGVIEILEGEGTKAIDPEPPTLPGLRRIAKFRDGFVIAGRDGAYVEYDRASGKYCEPHNVREVRGEAMQLVPFGPRLLFVLGDIDESEPEVHTQVVVLEER